MGLNYIFEPLSTVVSSATNQSQQHQDKNHWLMQRITPRAAGCKERTLSIVPLHQKFKLVEWEINCFVSEKFRSVTIFALLGSSRSSRSDFDQFLSKDDFERFLSKNFGLLTRQVGKRPIVFNLGKKICLQKVTCFKVFHSQARWLSLKLHQVRTHR